MLSGTTPTQWTAKHVIAHHVETNVVPVDDDTMYPMKRVLVALPRLAYHRYQHIYMWLMYLVTLPLWTASNAVKVLACLLACLLCRQLLTPLLSSPFDAVRRRTCSS